MKSTELSELVRRGLDRHHRGDLDGAGRIYCEVLSADPLQPDALHLFGVAMHQLGEHRTAVKGISRAIAVRPTMAHFHANLGEVYRALGRQNLAEGCTYLALKLRPDLFASTDVVDLLLGKGGRFDDVPSPRRESSGIDPSATVEYTAIATGLHTRGDRAETLDRLVEALDRGTGEVWMSAQTPETWNDLGNILRSSGRLIEAMSSYLNAIRLAPDLASAHNNLGRILLDGVRAKEALVWFRFALDLEPTSIMIRSNIASALRDLGRLDEARAFAEETLSMNPRSDEAHLTLASIHIESRRHEEAARSFRESVRLNPESLDAHLSLGIFLAEMGDFEGAERSFREVLRRRGPHAQALARVVGLHQGRASEEDLVALRGLLDEPNLPELHRAELHYAAASVDDARGDYRRSADHLRKANAIQAAGNRRSGRSYRLRENEEFVEGMMEACSAGFFHRVEGFGIGTDRLAFVVGLPRSGTSLTEQILASHSKVYGMGESSFAWRNFRSLPDLLGLKSEAVECLGHLDREASIEMAEEFLARVEAIERRASLVVDKMPDNYLYLGWLATLFPRAKFIHCRRDLRDTAVSCWATNFSSLEWANDIEHIASRFTAYRNLMDHWARVLPAPVLHVDYEQTVADLESAARMLIEWCGLEWEPTCLNFHEVNRVVHTASFAQVRRPIYRRSVGRWRNYEEELGPLFERLEVLQTSRLEGPAEDISPSWPRGREQGYGHPFL
jgi:tetratricopeptide (TPR) repeat protein